MVPTLPDRLKSIAVGPYAPLAKPLLAKALRITKRIVDDSKVTDHHAIIPTEQPVQLNALNHEERRLYDLIVKRFLALFYPACRYDETRLIMTASGETFHAAGRVMKDSGWKEIYGMDITGADDSEDEADAAAHETFNQLLPELTQGQRLKIGRCLIREDRTKPPARFTEATLLTQMEKHHLGTPATRADIIEKLLSTDTIERQGNRLVPTGKGKQLIELVSDELRSPEMTANWERELENIARKKGDSKRFMQEIRELTIRLVQEVKSSNADYKPHNLTHAHCPDCGEPLLEVKTKRGKRLVCRNRECGYSRAAEPVMINRRCPQCHKKMELHNGKAGKYAQCRLCNVIEKLDDSAKGKFSRRRESQLARQYSDNVALGTNLGEALKAALAKQREDRGQN